MSGSALKRRLREALAPHLGEPCLLAVSGGPDSTALLHSAATQARAGALSVATVDHGLRPESRGEAEAVAGLAAALGLPHRILAWAGPHPATGLQAAARDARYALLARHAAERGCTRILTAHTRDDQAETLIMRLVRGSGPAGLAGMRSERALAPGLTLARPFLDLRKDDLVAWCAEHGLAYLRDPSNADPRFARARLRRLMPLLEGEGLSVERLARLAERAARDEAALRAIAEDALARLARPAPKDGIHIDGRGLVALPEAVALRVLDRALIRAGARTGRLERLERLDAALRAALKAGLPLRCTARGLLVTADRAGLVGLAPAPPRRRGMPAADPVELLGNG